MRQLLTLILLFTTLTFSQEKLTVIKGARVIPIDKPEIENGVVAFQKGIIVYAGKSDGFSIPSDAEVIEGNGKVVMPGLIDTHSHIGGGDGGDASSALHPDVRILDAIDPLSPSFMRARSGGITSVNIMPGSGHLMSGQTVYVKTRKTNKIEEMLFCDDPVNDVCGGLKMANGTNSKRPAPFPETRGKSAAMVRQLFIDAIDYKSKMEKSPTTTKRDLGKETLVQVLDKKRIVQHHTHRSDDILTVIRLAKEFNLDVVLHHVSEGYLVADRIAEAKIPCSAIMIDAPGGKLETVKLSLEIGAILEKAGVDVAFHTDDYITDSRLFLRSAALAVRGGMSVPKALEALTLAGARMLGVEERTGSLTKGKDADIIILSGDPLSVYTKVEKTFVDGTIVYDYSNPEDRKFVNGGYRVYRDNSIHSCHEDHLWD